MSFIQISNLSANPGQIRPGDQVNLSYALDGDDQTPITITYLLNNDNNVYFQLSNGTLTKTIIDPFTLNMPPDAMQKMVTITKLVPPPAGQDFNQFDIYVKAVSNVNGNQDIKHCNISFL